jgi:hypothetical protein
MGCSIEIPIQSGDVAPPSHNGHGHNQHAKVHEMVPVKVSLQGLKEVVQSGGNAYHAEHEAVLLLPLAGGR